MASVHQVWITGHTLEIDLGRPPETSFDAGDMIRIVYGFGGGADALSFEDFGRHVHPDAHVHVLCPRPDNADLCKQVGHVLRGRPRDFRVFGQPFRWRSFAEALLEVLKGLRSNHIRATIGREFEITLVHDRKVNQTTC